ncbi:MAG: peptidase [Rubricoccaceae bacterium]|nr:peptidase [Rubricoccaceae bacterium]
MAPPSHLLFVFLDGVGLGPPGAMNPLTARPLPAFRRLAGGADWSAVAPATRTPAHVFRSLDATLGLEGLPQSGTGQASLFSGVNCAALAGRHFGPYPHSTSKPVLEAESVFARLRRAGHAAGDLAFANAYPDRFFRYAEGRSRWTVTTFSCRASGVRLRTAADLRAGRALAADLTAAGWPGAEVPVVSEAEAGARLARLAAAHRFTLFEYFLTDKAGHAQDAARAGAVLGALDRFFGALLDARDPGTLLVVSSDHGNLEDLSVKTHTRHPVPLVALGPRAGTLADAESLTDVTPGLVGLLAR